jgi:hypothetical protein
MGWDVLLNTCMDRGYRWRKTSMLFCSSARAFMAAAALAVKSSWQLAVGQLAVFCPSQTDMDRTTSPPSTKPTLIPRRSPRPFYFHSNTPVTGGYLFCNCNIGHVSGTLSRYLDINRWLSFCLPISEPAVNQSQHLAPFHQHNHPHYAYELRRPKCFCLVDLGYTTNCRMFHVILEVLLLRLAAELSIIHQRI